MTLVTISFEANSANAESLQEVQQAYKAGMYFSAARKAFALVDSAGVSKADAYSWITLSLVKAKMFHSASYFFIRTLQYSTGSSRSSVRRVLEQTELLVMKMGGELFRKFLVAHTNPDDYDDKNLNAFYYLLAKDALLQSDEASAIKWSSKVQKSTALRAYALQIRGTAHAISGQTAEALEDFKSCIESTNNHIDQDGKSREDLKARCEAGVARTYYQEQNFERADRAYSAIPKASFIWTDILFEEAWNSYSLKQYNRSLGKLVTYRSPDLRFVFNSESDVLRAQTFLGLCLYADTNSVVNEFNEKYGAIGVRLKSLLEKQPTLVDFFELGKRALKAPLHTDNELYRIANRFIRSPTFETYVQSEKSLEMERRNIRATSQEDDRGLAGFLGKVLNWKQATLQILGGAFVKNSLLDHYQILVNDFEKMSFIKLEMLKRTKEELLNPVFSREQRERGNVIPSRRDDQMYWEFNGEFWSDELGDYVFGLQSQC